MNPGRLAAASALLLGVWDALWYGVVFPSTALAPPLAAALLATPILLCVPALARGTPLALGTAGMLAIGYLAHGLTELVASPAERSAAAIASGLALGVMLSTMHALRVRGGVKRA